MGILISRRKGPSAKVPCHDRGRIRPPPIPTGGGQAASLFTSKIKVNPPLERTGKGGKRKGPSATADWRGCPRAGGWVACRLGGGGGETRELDTP